MAMINDIIINLLQYRIEQEEYSSRIYKAMSVWLDFNGYSGAAKLYKKYSEEELIHAKWAYDYLSDLNILPNVPPQPQPQLSFTGLPQVIAMSYQHEVKVTKQCQELCDKARLLGDDLTYQLGLKYMSEQAQELGKVQYWVDQLNAFGDDRLVLRLMDKEMGKVK